MYLHVAPRSSSIAIIVHSVESRPTRKSLSSCNLSHSSPLRVILRNQSLAPGIRASSSLFTAPRIVQRWLELVSSTSSCGSWLRDFAAATVTVLVVQAVTAQDISHALSSPCNSSRILLDSCASSSPRSMGMTTRLGCGGAKKFQLLRAPTRPHGASKGRGFGGASSSSKSLTTTTTALEASSSSLITGSLTSPLAAIVNAGSHLDLNVLRASFASSLNLISLCSFVVWMQRSGQLSAETPVVLSQVAFRVLIPCFLMTKVAVTLASHPTASLLFLPLVAIAQVLVGALLGKAACRLIYGGSSGIMLPAFEATVSTSSAPTILSEKDSGVITQVEKPLSTINFSRQSKQYMRVKKEALVTAACAFGNSFTLPLIFMTGVLGGEETSKIAGMRNGDALPMYQPAYSPLIIYLALFMVGWSPVLWTVGYSIIATGDEDSDLGESFPKDNFSWTTLVEGFRRIMNPPLYGVLIGVLVGGTPLSHFFLPGANGATISVQSTGAFAFLRTSTAGILRPVFDAATLLGTATLAVQTIVLASSLAASLPPLGDTKRSLEPEAVSCSVELDLVLDTRAFWIISSVRLVAMPVIVIISTVILQYTRILPVDPVYNLLILAQSAMPSAQNLVLLSQLRASTRRLSGVLARLLLRQYAMSIIPITFWMALFLAIAKPS